MKSNAPPVTLEELVGEYERELDVRKRGYPKFVQAGKLTQEEADRRIEILEYGLARERSNLTAIQARNELDAEDRKNRNKDVQDFAQPSYGSRKKGAGHSGRPQRRNPQWSGRLPVGTGAPDPGDDPGVSRPA